VIRQLRRSAVGLVAAGTLVAGLTACAAPTYTYAADSTDHAYFKVPASWPQVGPQTLSGLQAELGTSLAGSGGGTLAWSRAYDGASHPAPSALLFGSHSPVVYASVQDMAPSVRNRLSYEAMRNLLLPVTAAARQSFAAAGVRLPSISLIFSETITEKNGVRGINEVYVISVRGHPDTIDQTVMTDSSTTKLYLLLVQCYQDCFISHEAQIKTVVQSFTVRGS
jgi:hypothetical protein